MSATDNNKLMYGAGIMLIFRNLGISGTDAERGNILRGIVLHMHHTFCTGFKHTYTFVIAVNY